MTLEGVSRVSRSDAMDGFNIADASIGAGAAPAPASTDDKKANVHVNIVDDIRTHHRRRHRSLEAERCRVFS